jgi:hypothetical protein
MIGVLLNIGHDIVDILVKIITYINEVRASSAPLKVILWPIMYGLTVVKVIIKVLANGSQKLYNDTIPSRIVILRVHTLTATPANIYLRLRTPTSAVSVPRNEGCAHCNSVFILNPSSTTPFLASCLCCYSC